MATVGGPSWSPVRTALATSSSDVGLTDNSGVGRKQLLKQATPGLSVRIRPSRSKMPELQGHPLHPFRLQEVHVGVAVVLTFA